MQKILFLSALFLITLVSCKKDPIHGLSLSGTKWVVTYFLDNSKDETADFDGYSFEFKADGTFIGYLPDGTSEAGTWMTHDHESKIQLHINGVQHLDKLDDDWTVLVKTDANLKIMDNNPSHPEAFHFQKK
jgi:hypothetical protein